MPDEQWGSVTVDPAAAGPPVLTTFAPAGEASVATIVLNRPHARNAVTLELAARPRRCAPRPGGRA